MKISEVCIKRPVFATVLSLVVMLIGIVSYTRLPVREYLTRMGERPHVQRVNADRKANTAEMLARQTGR